MSRNKVVALVACVLAFSFFAVNLFAAESVLKVAERSGKVLVKVSPSAEWVEATVGQALNPQDSVKTGERSNAILAFQDKSSVSLKPMTEITVEELVWNNRIKKSTINMNEGELRVIIKKLDTPSEFKVRTPTAICGARGTIFYVAATPAETMVYVSEGMVELTNAISGESSNVVEGMTATSNANGSISEPQESSAGEKAAATSGYDTGLVAEPYTEPAGAISGAAAGANAAGGASAVAAPEVTPENTASKI